MKYPLPSEIIPAAKRADINNKISLLIESGQAERVGPAAIFQGFTGDGGLHGLKYADFSSFHDFTKAKKEIENGQFFTPASLCKQIVDTVPVSVADLVADLTCGMGNFFNFLPVEANAYGCELESKSFKVARYLYPEATLENKDIRYYNPDVQFDIIFGNPPFNLTWDVKGEKVISQLFFMKKAEQLLVPGGIMAVIVPQSFMNDDFMTRHTIEYMDFAFSFLCQSKLPDNVFNPLGVSKFATKVMYFQKKFDGIPFNPYNVNSFVDFNVEAIRSLHIQPALEYKQKTAGKAKLSAACGINDWSRKNSSLRKASGFEFQLKKYLFEIKTHPACKDKLGKALAYLNKYKNQQKPENMKWEEWGKVRITEPKVLAYFRQIVNSQSKQVRSGFVTVCDRSGIRFKSYDAATTKKLNELGARDLSWVELVQDPGLAQRHPLASEIVPFLPVITKRKKLFDILDNPILETPILPQVKSFVDAFQFITPKNEVSSLSEKQRSDIYRALSRPFSILSWQQGSGKTCAASCVIQYYLQTSSVRNVFVIGPPIAIRNTWVSFMERNNYSYTTVFSITDLSNVVPGQIVLMPLTVLTKIKSHVRAYVKSISNNALLVFDESDEITNYSSKRSHAVRDVFRRLRYKLLTTGTTTRNNLTELYGQVELLYNNSANFICDCDTIYSEERFKDSDNVTQVEIVYKENPRFNKPFPARAGMQLFKSCYNPSKSTVFGIQQHNQDIYNIDSLRKLVERTVITRKFKDIAGEGRYFMHTHRLVSKPYETELYRQILDELSSILPSYYSSTGNARKDAMLRIIRQLQLLIKSCSVPQHLAKVSEAPAKAGYMLNMVKEFNDERIMIGSNNVKGATYYANYFREHTDRPVFFVTGESHSIEKRQEIVDLFKSTTNGILVCTQQSLSSSVNIPECSRVILESLLWNFPRMEQFMFRVIRFDSPKPTNVHFVVYTNSIEVNLMALLTAKERLNDFIKTLELRDHSEVMEDFDMDESFLEMLLEKVYDEEGNVQFNWGKQKVA